jgi:hypothetical protein
MIFQISLCLLIAVVFGQDSRMRVVDETALRNLQKNPSS